MFQGKLKLGNNIQPSGYLVGRLLASKQTSKGCVICTKEKMTPIKVRPEVFYGLHHGEKFSATHTLILLCWIQCLAEIRNDSLNSPLHLGQYCTDSAITSIRVEYIRLRRVWVT